MALHNKKCRWDLMAIGIASTMMSAAYAQCSSASQPARIEITTVPRAGAGGPDAIEPIAGRVDGESLLDVGVILYAHAGGRWWAQVPFATVTPSGQWQAYTHLGSEYAALLVHKSFVAASEDIALPAIGGCVRAAVTVSGSLPSKSAAPARVVRFSNQEWTVKSAQTGPGPNHFSNGEENVRVDAEGRLHLRITFRDGQWHCAEIMNRASLGYGTYRFSVTSVDPLDPNAVLGLFTWSDDPAYAHRELDVELSRWGRIDNQDGQYVVQPWDRPHHQVKLAIFRVASAQ